MRVRAWRAQPGAWSGRRRRRWLLVVGDAALAVALAAAFYLATLDHYGDTRCGGGTRFGCWPWWPGPRWAQWPRRSPSAPPTVVWGSSCWWPCIRWPRTA